MARFRILVLEDEPETASLVEDLLGETGYAVEHAGTVAAARERAKQGDYDLFVVDRTLPDGEGLDFCHELRRGSKTRKVPVLFLTAKGRPDEKVEGLRAGGDDYLAKPFDSGELCARVEALLRRSGRLGRPESLQHGVFSFDFDKRRLTAKGRAVELAPREFDLLALLASQKGRVLSREFLLETLYGVSAGQAAETKSVDVTISQARQKLGAAAAKLVTVRGFGYRLDP
ncbi:MAG: response regulator transcription factor [Elusimicrobia bacterium]|nr:response regulator transcription factor [Elusimicrobiota bacterium]